LKTLIVERDERGVVAVTMNRPEKKNAIDYLMFQELLEVFGELSDSSTDRVLVLTGAEGTSAPARTSVPVRPTATSST
jgi:enoyl-CoA hydratase/carnithine racemase